MTSFFRHTIYFLLSIFFTIFPFICELYGGYSALEDVLHTNLIVDIALFLGRNETKKKKLASFLIHEVCVCESINIWRLLGLVNLGKYF